MTAVKVDTGVHIDKLIKCDNMAVQYYSNVHVMITTRHSTDKICLRGISTWIILGLVIKKV